MSAVPAHSLPAPHRIEETDRQRRLRPAPERAFGRAKPTLGYAVIALGSVAIIIVAQLLLSIAVTQGAYELDKYQVLQAELAREQQTLGEDLDRVQSPQFLAANAEALGMVPNASPVYLRLSDGAVLGQPTAATGGAAASAPLVPNTLIDGVPLVTEQQNGNAEHAAKPEPASDPVTPNQAAAPPAGNGIPTPATH